MGDQVDITLRMKLVKKVADEPRTEQAALIFSSLLGFLDKDTSFFRFVEILNDFLLNYCLFEDVRNSIVVD